MVLHERILPSLFDSAQFWPNHLINFFLRRTQCKLRQFLCDLILNSKYAPNNWPLVCGILKKNIFRLLCCKVLAPRRPLEPLPLLELIRLKRTPRDVFAHALLLPGGVLRLEREFPADLFCAGGAHPDFISPVVQETIFLWQKYRKIVPLSSWTLSAPVSQSAELWGAHRLPWSSCPSCGQDRPLFNLCRGSFSPRLSFFFSSSDLHFAGQASLQGEHSGQRENGSETQEN